MIKLLPVFLWELIRAIKMDVDCLVLIGTISLFFPVILVCVFFDDCVRIFWLLCAYLFTTVYLFFTTVCLWLLSCVFFQGAYAFRLSVFLYGISNFFFQNWWLFRKIFVIMRKVFEKIWFSSSIFFIDGSFYFTWSLLKYMQEKWLNNLRKKFNLLNILWYFF